MAARAGTVVRSWVRRSFSFRHRARWLALIAIGPPALAVLLTIVIPRIVRMFN